MFIDRDKLLREYEQSNSLITNALQKKLDTSLARKQSKIDAIPNIDSPEILPVSEGRLKKQLQNIRNS